MGERKAFLLISGDLSHPALAKQQYSFSWRINRLRPLTRLGYYVIVICAAGIRGSSALSELWANLRPMIIYDRGIIVLRSPLLKLPFVWFFSSLVASPFYALAYAASKGIKIEAIVASSVAYGAIAKVANLLFKTTLIVDYGDPEYLRLKGPSLWFLKFLERFVIFRGGVSLWTYFDPVIGERLSRLGVRKSLFLPPGGYAKNTSRPITETQGDPSRKIILYAGHVASKPYRLDLLVEAAPAVLDKHKEAKFVIVGAGRELRRLMKVVRERGLERHFLFTGPLPYPKAKEWISKATVALQLLDDMCMGTKLIDYMALGKAAVACGKFYNKYREFLKDGENCLLCPPDARELAAKINELLSNEKLRKTIEQNAIETMKIYDWDSQATRLLIAIKTLNQPIRPS
jgi:glycosyltransferase involved in cell wall biosynthesis